jgi:general secretion pathway protein K
VTCRRRGTALVFALWIALLLGVAGIAATRLAAVGAGSVQVEMDLAAARAAAEGGIWAAAFRLAALPREARAPALEFAFPLGAAAVAVRAADEDGRLDLNAAPETLLAAMFGAAGVEEREAAALAARVAEWRRPGRPGSPSGLEETGPFRGVGELGAVPGVGIALAERLRPILTIHTGRAQPAAEAAPPALQALLGQPPPALAAPGGRGGFRTPQPGGSGGAGRRTTWRIEAEARQGAVIARVAAVITIAPANGMPGRVLEWRPVGP